MSPSPLYVLLSCPKGWVGTPQENLIAQAIRSGAWAFDPNETPDGGKPLFEVMVDGFENHRSSTIDGLLIATGFRQIASAVLAAGAKLSTPLPTLPSFGNCTRWIEKVALCGVEYAGEMTTVVDAALLLNATKTPKLKEFKEWMDERGLELTSPVAGAPLFAHLAMRACENPIAWSGGRVDSFGSDRDGWLLIGHQEKGNIESNRSSALQRMNDVLAFHDLARIGTVATPTQKALWWLMAWPLTLPHVASPEKRQAFDQAFAETTQNPDLLKGLEALLDKPWPSLRSALGSAVLAAISALPETVPAQKMWEMTVKALDTVPTPSEPAPTMHRWDHWAQIPMAQTGTHRKMADGWRVPLAEFVRKAVGQVAQKWGYPELESLPLLEAYDVLKLWSTALHAGLCAPTAEQGGQWSTLAQSDPSLEWPDESTLQRIASGARDQGTREAIVRWYRHSQMEANLEQASASTSTSKVRL